MDPERADESSTVARLSSSVSPVSDFPESAWPPSIPPGSERVSTTLLSIAEGHASIDPEKRAEKGGTHKHVPPVANETNYPMIPSVENTGNLKVGENIGAPRFNVGTCQTANEIARDQTVVQNKFVNVGAPGIAHQNSNDETFAQKGSAHVGKPQIAHQNLNDETLAQKGGTHVGNIRCEE